MTGQRPPGPVLVALDGPAAGAHVPIPLEGLSIGRATVPALRRDPAVSGRHALIRWTGDGRLMIEDRGSRNGTWVNGAEATGPMVIGAGDHIRIGAGTYELRIERPMAQDPAAGSDAVAIHGGLHASSGGVAAGRDIHGDIQTYSGDYYENYQEAYDPTGLSDVSGFPRFLMVVGIFIALAGFALFAYPIVLGLISAGDASAAHAACDQQFEPATQESFDCHFNVNSGITFEIAPWMPIGAGLLFVGMVLTIVARIMKGNDEPRGRRRA